MLSSWEKNCHLSRKLNHSRLGLKLAIIDIVMEMEASFNKLLQTA